ncbi:phage tail tape measure protein [Bacteroides sp. 51]|uniref:phage tail tape measure protein n=1 Tax=Bacteroides sp. 51 TaxID=2302938 RepID=UPI0013D037CC|nr:phage tail tape measure protein [Bacteroides sp. 51]NDV80836.1 phage tail tape measure protein [Bacteroides sp. 51]
MSQGQFQNYTVNYTINVDATKGVQNVTAFADSVARLTAARTNLDGAVNNIKKMMDEIDRVFRTKAGRKRDYSYKFNIDTSGTEKKLERVQALLVDIAAKTKGINLVLTTGKALNTKGLKNQANALLNNNINQQGQSLANGAAKSFLNAQQQITKSIGKINAGLKSIETREIKVNTTQAKSRLQEIITLLTQVRTLSAKGSTLRLNSSSLLAGNLKYAPINPASFTMTDKAQQRLNERLYANQRLAQQKRLFQQQEEAAKIQRQNALAATRRMEREQARLLRQQEALQKKALAEQRRREREAQRRQQQNAAGAIRNAQRQSILSQSMYGGTRRAAINRLQYSRAPNFRNLPFAYMFNAYMAYSLVKSELTKAVEYANIMESAHSILKVADTDLATFETRFDKMARYVRQIGVETKFTAIEVAGAVKYLSMAGMGIETINASIRPITNLALIGDNDISQIADLATNIMAGYDIKSSSMPSVADILASTVSRSNVNIIEMAESFKMSAGYMKMAGVDFTESSAAIGILGNMGVKGTMAGTSLRAMATRFAKPTKEASKTLERLGIQFTEYQDIYGKQVERLRPLADIFEELKKKGATMADMQAIFGKIGGNAAMMFLKNYDKLRELSSHNRASQGISGELAKVKQDTTKGLWYQVTSQFSESFMQSFELLEPRIKGVLKSFLAKFKAPEFAQGINAIGNVLLDIFSVLSNIATWFTRNFYWLEPMLFTSIVATRIFKLAGAITNLGVALGFLGKQNLAGSSMNAISALLGGMGTRNVKALTFANKRAIVSAMAAAGITGKGAMSTALMNAGLMGGPNAIFARGAASSLFAQQVATGNGLIGAGASISALGTGAVAATAGIAALVAALGWLAYKTWKVKKAKDAVLEEIEANRKYRYPSIEALHDSLSHTYTMAVNAKKAVDDLTSGKTVQEESGQKIGAFTSNWWGSLFSSWAVANSSRYGMGTTMTEYTTQDAYQDDAVAALVTLAKKDSQARVNSAFAEFGKFRSALEVGAFIENIHLKYGQDENKLDPSLWTTDHEGRIKYKKGIEDLKSADAHKTWHYANYHNTVTVKEIEVAAHAYQKAIADGTGARALIEKAGFNFSQMPDLGYYQNDKGLWVQKSPGKNATDTERQTALSNTMKLREQLVALTSTLRNTFGGSSEAAENIMRTAGFTPQLFSNEPLFNDTSPFNANGITNNHLSDGDDGYAGGNYSGTGKLSSAAPKQVIVNITNLLSVETIDLLKSEEGQMAEVQNLKEQLAQVLIDVVHDFDASWNS